MATWLWRNRFQLTMPKFAPKDERDNAENMRAVERAVNALSIIPTGGIILWGIADIPELFLELNGQAVSRGTYRDLFALWGTTYGVGDGSTTFNVANIAGKVVVGLDTGDASFDAIWETGGAKTVTLTTAEMPAHTHTIDMDVTLYIAGVSEAAAFGETGDGISNANTSGLISSEGGGGAHANLQPYITLKYIVKT